MNCLGCTKFNKFKTFLLILFVFSAFINLSSCKPKSLNRPPGYIKLGYVEDLLAPENNIEEAKVLLRRDDRGFYAMSTYCTYDLTYLNRKNIGGKDLWVSTYTESKYDLTGKVVSGPSTVDLPYYELKLDSATYGGPRNTLYVYIGKQVAPDWRLQVK